MLCKQHRGRLFVRRVGFDQESQPVWCIQLSQRSPLQLLIIVFALHDVLTYTAVHTIKFVVKLSFIRYYCFVSNTFRRELNTACIMITGNVFLCIAPHTSWKEVNEMGFQSRTLRPDNAAQVLSPPWGHVLATEAFWKMVVLAKYWRHKEVPSCVTVDFFIIWPKPVCFSNFRYYPYQRW